MEENKALEAEIKKLFVLSRQLPKQSAKSRIQAILSRGLHEIALQDLLNFAAYLAITMFNVLMAYLKILFRVR